CARRLYYDYDVNAMDYW
nr:immunoglobulin heavy chain junction region [Mus musculus]